MIVTGTSNLVLVGKRPGWTKDGGPYIDYIYEGTDDACRTFAEASLSQIDAYDINPEGGSGKHQLTIRVGSHVPEGQSELPQDDVRMDVNRINKDIFTHPNFSGYTEAQMATVRKAAETKVATDITAAQAVLSGNALLTFNLVIKSNLEYWTVYQPVLIKTRTASSAYAFAVSYANCGRIISSGFLANEAELGGILRFTLPDLVSSDARFVYGWLKHFPSYAPGPNNRYVLTQEYEYGAWSTLLYGALVVAA